MAFSPDLPFPKTPGNPIMAKDWNDAIAEVQRLDTAKIGRVAAEAMAGPLTINNALAVGTTSAAQAGTRLHVVDTLNPTVARLQTTATNGSARLELWSDPRNSGTEWRPGSIESFDLGSYTGGLRFFTNGTGVANRQALSEQLRLVNGVAGFGVTDPAYRIDTNGQIRSRQGTGAGGAGMHLHQTVPNANRAFVGMQGDNAVGFMGAAGGGWGLQMDVTNGNVGIKTAPGATNALTLQGNSQFNGDISNTGNTLLGQNVPGSPSLRLDVLGRVRFRDGGGLPAGIWFYNQASTAPQDRAFIGLNGDTTLGLWGNTNGGWGLQMDTTSGVVTCSRVHSSNVKTQVLQSSFTSTTSGSWSQILNMSVTFFLPVAATCFVNLVLPGCALDGVTGNWGTGIRLLMDGVTQLASQTVYFNWTSGVFETRHLVLSTFSFIPAGTHTIAAQWYTQGGQFYCSNGGADRVLQVIEIA